MTKQNSLLHAKQSVI